MLNYQRVTVLFMGVISTMGITKKKRGGTKFLLKKWKLCVWIILGCYSISIIQWIILLIDRVGPILTSLKTRKGVRIHNVVGFLTSSTIDLEKKQFLFELLLPYQSFSCCNCSIIINHNSFWTRSHFSANVSHVPRYIRSSSQAGWTNIYVGRVRYGSNCCPTNMVAAFSSPWDIPVHYRRDPLMKQILDRAWKYMWVCITLW